MHFYDGQIHFYDEWMHLSYNWPIRAELKWSDPEVGQAEWLPLTEMKTSCGGLLCADTLNFLCCELRISQDQDFHPHKPNIHFLAFFSLESSKFKNIFTFLLHK